MHRRGRLARLSGRAVVNPLILVVDDDDAVQFAFTRYLTKCGYDVSTASNLQEAREQLGSRRFDAILLDLNLPDGNGIDWIADARKSQSDVALIVITGLGDIPTAVEAMRRGADHFLTKPVNMSELEVFLKKSIEIGSLRRDHTALQRLSKQGEPFFGESPEMKEVQRLASIACGNDSILLVSGETGTGKGVLARWIHERSKRGASPFVEVNCSNLRGDLLASELFGHARGAFTSAGQDRQGLVEFADKGTLFLDEIGDMDLQVQAQLLKVIEEKQFRRLGEVKTRTSDFRLICATNKDLASETNSGKFRLDLYYRIFIFPVIIPPLRRRMADLEALVEYFLKQMNAGHLGGMPGSVLGRMLAYHWPGNIREMKNVLERAILLSCGGPLGPEHFLIESAPVCQSRTVLQKDEQAREAIRQSGGNMSKAARSLGISRATLYRKMKKE